MSKEPEETTRNEAGSVSASKPTSRYAYYVLLLLTLGNLMNFVDRSVLNVVLDPVKEELGVSDTYMGFLTGLCFSVFYVAMAIPIARWADLGSRRSILALGMAVWSGMTVLSGMARSTASLTVARIGTAVGEAAGTPTSVSLLADYFDNARRPKAIGIFQGGLFAGILVGYTVAGIVSELWGWRAAFFVAGIPGLLLALLIRFTLREPIRGMYDPNHAMLDGSKYHTLRQTVGHIFRQPAAMLICLGTALSVSASFGFLVWAPSMLRRSHEMSGAETGVSTGLLFGLMGMIGTVSAGFIASHMHNKGKANTDCKLLAICAGSVFLAMPFATIFLLSDDITVSLFGFGSASVLLTFSTTPCLASYMSLTDPRIRSVAMSIWMLIISLVGQGLGPLVVGVASDFLNPTYGDEALRYALFTTFIAITLSAICMLAAIVYFNRDKNRLTQVDIPVLDIDNCTTTNVKA